MMKSIKRKSKRDEKHITFEYTGDNEEDIPNNVTHVRVLHGVTTINTVFHDRVRLESITFPSTVVEIGDHAFYRCNALLSAELPPNGLLRMGNKAFGKCDSLVNVAIPTTIPISEVDEDPFKLCSKLRLS